MKGEVGSGQLASDCLEEGFHLDMEVVNLVEFGHPRRDFNRINVYDSCMIVILLAASQPIKLITRKTPQSKNITNAIIMNSYASLPYPRDCPSPQCSPLREHSFRLWFTTVLYFPIICLVAVWFFFL